MIVFILLLMLACVCATAIETRTEELGWAYTGIHYVERQCRFLGLTTPAIWEGMEYTAFGLWFWTISYERQSDTWM
jgi:hypothetical protein